MGKLKLSVQRKNERRRKYGIYPVRILRDNVDIMRVSIPLQALSYILSLPISAYHESLAGSLQALQERIVSLPRYIGTICIASDCLASKCRDLWVWCYSIVL